MKNLIKLSVAFLFVIASLSSCKKSELNPNNFSHNQDEYYTIVETVNDKSANRGEGYSEWYDFSMDKIQGQLLLQLDENSNLILAKMSRDLYYHLVKRSSAKEVESLPQNLLNQSKLLRKSGYSYWGSSNFIPPMSKDEFNRKFEKCVSKPTNAGAILCTVNLLTQAVLDCITATPPTEKIHCW